MSVASYPSSSNSPMYSFVVEEVSNEHNRPILNQAIIFAHDEDDALERHRSMYPKTGHNVRFRVFPHVQLVALHQSLETQEDGSKR